MNEPEFPDYGPVIGVYCFTYPDHEGKDKHTCDHCVELYKDYLTPEIQALINNAEEVAAWMDAKVEAENKLEATEAKLKLAVEHLEMHFIWFGTFLDWAEKEKLGGSWDEQFRTAQQNAKDILKELK